MILVTGGAGFIGSNLVRNLLKKNEKIVVIDNFNSFYDPKIKEKNIAPFKDYIILYRVDILDEENLNEIFSRHVFKGVYHLAAMGGVSPSIKDPKLYSDINVRGTINLLELCKTHEIKKFIFASSSSVYGNNKKVPFCETDVVDYPISPYAATKKACELICHTYSHLYNMDISCLRYFNAFGPNLRPDLVMHKFINLLIDDKPLPIYGDGTSKRDYTFIDDIIDGTIKAFDNSNGYNIYNLGNSSPIKIMDLAILMTKLMNKTLKIEYKSMKPGDVSQTYADISKAQKELNYNTDTTLEEGVKKYITWFISNIKK